MAVYCHLQEDRETLREQLRAAPAEGNPNDVAINVAKVSPAALLGCVGAGSILTDQSEVLAPTWS